MTWSRLAPCVALASACLAFAVPRTASAQCPTAPVTDHGRSVEGKPLASPPAVTETHLDGKLLTIHYNAPSVRCRKIMGGVVPYGKVWRTGANPATSFETQADLMIGDQIVPAGKYTLYTLPEASGTPWLLIVNRQTGQWGTIYNQGQDLTRVPMKASTLDSPQEVMSIRFEKTNGASTELHVRWERTDEWVPIRLSHAAGH